MKTQQCRENRNTTWEPLGPNATFILWGWEPRSVVEAPNAVIACGAVVVRKNSAGELQALLIRQVPTKESELPQRSLKAGESRREAAVRALHEETGHDVASDVIVDNLIHVHTERYHFQKKKHGGPLLRCGYP